MQNTIWRQTLTEDQKHLLAAPDPLPRTAEVAVVGAGVIGLMTAYYLSAAGLRELCVLDRGDVLGEASGANAGGLWYAKESLQLGSLAPLACASSRLYNDLAQVIDFDLSRSGVLALLRTPESREMAEAVVGAAISAGSGGQRIGNDEVRRLEPALEPGESDALLFPGDGQLNPAKLGAGLVGLLRSRNVRICPRTEVLHVGTELRTSAGSLSAGTTVLTSGAWTPLLTRTLGWMPPIKPIRGQLLAVGPVPPLLRHTVVGEDYYYWQLRGGYIAGGGTCEDVGFEPGTDPQDLATIHREMAILYPRLREEPTVCAWSGFRPYCEDGKPVIGRVPGQDRIYVAAGHFRKGVMLAPVTGKIVADLLLKGWSDLPVESLRPERFPLGTISGHASPYC